MNSNEDAPLQAIWRRYLRAEDPFVEFRRLLVQTDMSRAAQLLDAYRALRDPITAENRERHRLGLGTFAQHMLHGDALTARAALQILLDNDLCDLQHAIEIAEIDAFCNDRFDDFSPILAVVARYRLDRNNARRVMTRAASTFGMLATLQRQNWRPLSGCQILVESGCHPLAVNIAARRSSPTLLIFESATEQSNYAGLGVASVNLDDYFVLNSPQEIECYQGIEQMADDILSRCASTPIPWLSDQRDILQANRFAIEDSLYAANKRASALCDLMGNVAAGVTTVALLSQGRLLRLIARAGRAQSDLYSFWCSHRQLSQREHHLRRFGKHVAAPRAPSCPPALLAALKPVLASYSRLEIVRQWVRAKLPMALAEALVELYGKRKALTPWKLWRTPLPRAAHLWRWQVRRRRLDVVLSHAAQRAMRDLEVPLEILFFTSASPIYLGTVRDLIRHTNMLGLRTCTVVRGLGNGAPEEEEHRLIDYLKFIEQARPQLNPFASYLRRHLRNLALAEVMVLQSRHGPLDLTCTIRQGMEAIVSGALLRSHLFQILVQLLLEHTTPQRVVVAPDRAPEALIVIQECRGRGLPTWAIQTVYHSRHPRYKPLQADFTTLIDTWSHSLFRDHFAIDPHRLFITGSPRMRFEPGENHAARGKQLLFICQRGVRFNLANLEYVLRNLARVQDYQLLVRPHPSETPQEVRSYHALLARYPQQHAIIDSVRPLRDVILETSVVLVAYSNVGLEAACYGVPVLVVNPMRIDYPVALDEMGIGYRVSDDEELRLALGRLHDDPAFEQQLVDNQRRYLAINPGLLHGDPVERIVTLITAENPSGNDAPTATSHAVDIDGANRTALQHQQDVKSV